jgi:ferredoxin
MTYYIVSAVVAFWIISRIILHIRRRGKIVCLTEENCTACGKCVKRCKHRVFELVKDGKKAHVVVKNPDKCTACGDCLGVCKFKALEIIYKNKLS